MQAAWDRSSQEFKKIGRLSLVKAFFDRSSYIKYLEKRVDGLDIFI